MTKITRIIQTFAALAVAVPVLACFNDRDTLGMEMRGNEQNEPIKAIVGWFPVHSPLYYQIRIDLAKASLKDHPDRLTLYDDAAVAYERLGQEVNAINVMEQKRAYMVAHHIAPKKIALPAKPTKEQIVSSSLDPWYRYYANTGTFWVHRWFHEGMPKAHKKEWLGLAQRDIDEAITLNPMAHGLREFAQDEMIRWIRTAEPGQSFSDFEPDTFWKNDSTTDALAGLVELGGAWESPDVFQAIVKSYDEAGLPGAAYFASLRVQELQKEGKRSLTGKTFALYLMSNDSDKREYLYLPPGADQNWQAKGVPPFVDGDFTSLRKAAEAYRQGLIAYELPLLRQGEHPDKDPDFWKAYKEPAFPEYGRDLYWDENMHKAYMFGGAVLVGIVVLLGSAIWFILWRKHKIEENPLAA